MPCFCQFFIGIEMSKVVLFLFACLVLLAAFECEGALFMMSVPNQRVSADTLDNAL